MKTRKKLRRIVPLFLAVVLCLTQCLPTAAITSAVDAGIEEDTVEAAENAWEDSNSTESSEEEIAVCEDDASVTAENEEAAEGIQEAETEEVTAETEDEANEEPEDAAAEVPDETETESEEEAEEDSEEKSDLQLAAAETMDADADAVESTPKDEGANTYLSDPFSEEYSGGYLTSASVTSVGEGVLTANYKDGTLRYYGNNTEKKDDIYFVLEDMAWMGGKSYDVVEYVWMSSEAKEEGFYWAHFTNTHTTLYTLVDGVLTYYDDEGNDLRSLTGIIYRELHFYESGHALDDDYEVTFNGVIGMEDCDYNEGWGIASGFIDVWLNNPTYLSRTQYDDDVYGSIYMWIGTENHDTDPVTSIWFEATGSAESPLVIIQQTRPSYSGKIDYTGCEVNYTIVGDVVPSSISSINTYYCATYSYYTPIDGLELLSNEEANYYTFSGWYYEEDLTNAVEYDSDGRIIVSADTSLYGKYEKIANKITTVVTNGTITGSEDYVEDTDEEGNSLYEASAEDSMVTGIDKYVADGEGRTVTFSPNTGYRLSSITITETGSDGESTVVYSYTSTDDDNFTSKSIDLNSGTELTISEGSVVISNLQEDLQIEVVYEANLYAVALRTTNGTITELGYGSTVETDVSYTYLRIYNLRAGKDGTYYIFTADSGYMLSTITIYTTEDSSCTITDESKIVYSYDRSDSTDFSDSDSITVTLDTGTELEITESSVTVNNILDNLRILVVYEPCYNVRYNSNYAYADGSTDETPYYQIGETSYLTFDDKYTILDNCFTVPSGWTFIGWNTKADGSGTGYAAGDEFTGLTSTAGETVDLYAQWVNYKLTFVKVSQQSDFAYDSYSTYVLEGAEFSLYEYVSEDNAEDAMDELLDTSNYDTKTWTLVEEGATSGSDGIVSFTGLHIGTTYRLIETASPTGYTISEGQWNVVLSLDEETGDISYTFTSVGSAPGVARVDSENGGTSVYLLQNEELKELPTTSGSGWKNVAWIGLLPVTAGTALIFFYLFRRKPAYGRHRDSGLGRGRHENTGRGCRP